MGFRIDIVDDDDAVRDSMHLLLETMGFDVHEYVSALDYLRYGPTSSDCLLVDQHMPDMTGIELLEHLRGHGNFTPALMITGRCDTLIEPRANELGAKVLHKPVKEDELLQEISRRCGEKDQS